MPSAKAPFVCAHPDRSQASSTRPAIKPCAGTAASTASHPNVRDDGQRPSSGQDSESYSLVFISEKQKYFCKRDWTADHQTAALICPSGNQRAIPGRNTGDRSPVRAEEFQCLLSRWEAAKLAIDAAGKRPRAALGFAIFPPRGRKRPRRQAAFSLMEVCHAQASRFRKPPQLSALRVSGGSPSLRKPMSSAAGVSSMATSN